jgi:hypothetical protein
MIPRPDRLIADVVGGAAEHVQTAVGLVGRADALLTQAEATLLRVDRVATAAEEQVELVRRVALAADRVAAAASGVVQRSGRLVGEVEPLAADALPVARRLVDSLAPAEVDAAVAIVDRLPTLIQGLDSDVLPVMRRLEQVGPDVHALLETVEDLRRMVEGLPGMGLVRRRQEGREDADD